MANGKPGRRGWVPAPRGRAPSLGAVMYAFGIDRGQPRIQELVVSVIPSPIRFQCVTTDPGEAERFAASRRPSSAAEATVATAGAAVEEAPLPLPPFLFGRAR